MKYTLPIILCFVAVIGIVACQKSDTLSITDAYMYETSTDMPAAAVFMTIENNSSQNAHMTGFVMDNVARTELHTMEMTNDVMKMRRVDRYNIPSDESFELKPNGAHIMAFGLTANVTEDQTLQGTAVFEKGKRIPVTITVKSRTSDMSGHNH